MQLMHSFGVCMLTEPPPPHTRTHTHAPRVLSNTHCLTTTSTVKHSSPSLSQWGDGGIHSLLTENRVKPPSTEPRDARILSRGPLLLLDTCVVCSYEALGGEVPCVRWRRIQLGVIGLFRACTVRGSSACIQLMYCTRPCCYTAPLPPR